ncbi:TPR repeat-containing protein [Natronincola peptidivorans]|uniref:TPR repeat-containing protein n=1 Tax=Natronincola peptidivorans TaxID=426128 RepID=A0A1I0EH70_9FIRM|nr:tetratricopeptide repeat protein [Natronincola peptidivorans]SET44722.1 TPR repeat-containing protein [Natronincola peptidivorans]
MKLETYIKKFERRVKKHPNDWQIHRKIGKRLVYKLKKKIKRNPKDISLINWCGIIALELNDSDLALEMFQRAVAVNSNVQTLNNLAYFYQIEYDDHQRAVELLERAVKMEPNSGLPYGLLGEAYLDLELYKKAAEAFTKALSFEENPSLLNNLGVALYKQGKIREAAIHFQKSWKSEDRIKDNFLDLILNYGVWDEYLNPVLSYGVSMAQLGKTKEAEEVAGKLKLFVKGYLEAGKNPIHLDIAFLEIAEIYYEAHSYTRANEMFHAALGPKMTYGISPRWISQYQYSLIQCEQLQEAEALLKKVILDTQKLMEEILEDDYYTQEEQQQHVDDYTQDIEEYKDLFQKVREGHPPSVDFCPPVMGNCYMFGCMRHGRPVYIKNEGIIFIDKI